MTTGSAPSTRKKLYSFEEARMMAQCMGFTSKDEWDEYSCPGAYQLPKDPDVLYSDQFVDWGDWLGVVLQFAEGREKTRSLKFKSEDEYYSFVNGKEPSPTSQETAFHKHAAGGKRTGVRVATRLPARPDLKYKLEWRGWDDW
eukprot:CAMPEP_0185771214 /NCGR_PEP_ID=MMETSP1174-20130828/63712_1 /TAXON_ID=35687 /ORGANISM="Dictyocha speculum, Strain CCMP1381" /LENGTH=142 /DNA_ID=CAMNT_0028457001 /DNA_START=94 /DNA_END=519 /DNA_ORIENTATION=+